AMLIPGSRKQKEFSENEIRQIAQTYHNWRETQWSENGYEDVPGFCKSVTLDEIKQHGFALTPGRYVGATDVEDDDEAFEEQMTKLTTGLSALFSRGAELEAEVRTQLGRVGYAV
ncbi:N-6 DNA methylase, partial [Ferrovum sp.]|uniref:N-6 DNA methylase n=1 Tax=Ferrovum sp. TaxID=2609467 RepID=UPI00262729C0